MLRFHNAYLFMYVYFSFLGCEKENNGFHNILLHNTHSDRFQHNFSVFVIPVAHICTYICIESYENHVLEIKGGRWIKIIKIIAKACRKV